ncbi:OB-fold domain-containing protein [Azoarcus sp. DN11]|uniref:Zn-ribbon domain-containing OB-fold protein n=1 Tax=Azoarcus sp. DN11 TaxID=356837 RepID=UPI000EACFD68|nr:OB-fold domain-containing protein [Azoarcus sp. DN11]AYH43524.1 hypothetical protein CDA09_09035 [Azoarcus sp. DN11]
MEQTATQDIPPSKRPLPVPHSNRDYDFFYQGLEAGKLLVQKCDGCGTVRNPPGPMCPHCHSLKWTPIECRGTGTVYSYTVHYHPPLPNFDSPHAIVLADMSEGFRLIGGLQGARPEDIRIGMPLVVGFERRGEVSTFHFRLA